MLNMVTWDTEGSHVDQNSCTTTQLAWTSHVVNVITILQCILDNHTSQKNAYKMRCMWNAHIIN